MLGSGTFHAPRARCRSGQMGIGIHESGDSGVDQLSIEFAWRRDDIEWSIAREILFSHPEGIRMAEKSGLTADHFWFHGDSRILFCACSVCRDHPKPVAVRIATLGLGAENIYVAERIPAISEESLVKNELMRMFWLGIMVRKLMSMDLIERDARGHYKACCALLAKGASL